MHILILEKNAVLGKFAIHNFSRIHKTYAICHKLESEHRKTITQNNVEFTMRLRTREKSYVGTILPCHLLEFCLLFNTYEQIEMTDILHMRKPCPRFYLSNGPRRHVLERIAHMKFDVQRAKTNINNAFPIYSMKLFVMKFV